MFLTWLGQGNGATMLPADQWLSVTKHKHSQKPSSMQKLT